MAVIKDKVGGIHEDGVGWNPRGTFCGECSNITCEGCYAIDLLNVGDSIDANGRVVRQNKKGE